ncbi:MAG: hypothetical protein K6E85_14315 [Lachnospiraceae bacterium]|nr:hypothetical protein [Lachnospiraceae bacterium]
MQSVKDRIVNVIKVIFGYGIMIALLVGGLSFFGYLAALIIGGDTALSICTFIYKKMYPVLVVVSTVMIAIGIFKMYLCKETAFTRQSKKTEEKKQ